MAPQEPNRRVHVRRFALHPTAVLTGRISPRGPTMSTLPWEVIEVIVLRARGILL